jgi:two-component system sensor histidine kinase UhpB
MTTNHNARLEGEKDGAIIVPINVVGTAEGKEQAFDPMAVLNSFSDALFVVSHTYQIIYLNTNARSLFNLPSAIPSSSTLLDLLPDQWLHKVRAYIARGFAGKGSSYEENARQVHKGCWWQLTYTPVWSAVGEVVNVSIAIKDITERKRIELFKLELQAYEEKLFLGRELFEQFMENAPFVAWVTDEKGIMQYMNPLYRQTYGFTVADTGKSVYELFPSQLAIDYHINNLKVINKGAALETTENAQTADGAVQILKIYKFPLYINGVVMVGGWAIDITEQQKMQEALTQSVERYHYANEATSDAIYDWDVVAGKIYRGEGFYTLFGYAEKEVSIRFRLSIIHPDDLEEYKKVVFNALRGNTTNHWHLEYRIKDVNGKYRYVMDKAFIINSAKRAIRVIGALQDITAQKELQAKLVQQERKSKREIIRSIIETQEKERRQLSVELHDNINQMLASCKLMLEVAQDNKEAAPALTKKSYESLQTVITEIRKLSHRLNPSAIEDIGLDEAIREMVDKINVSKKLEIDYSCQGSEQEERIQGKDKVAIYRIIQEQLSNILKHAQATHVHIQLNLQFPKVFITIQDNGVGFKAESVKRGLGLKSIQNRIDYYFGELNIETAKGKGCLLKAWINLEV